MSISLGGRPFGLFQNSYLPVFDTDLQTVTIVNERGEVAASFKPTVPGAAVLLIRDAAVSPEKTIVVSMGVKSADGRMAALLMFSDFKGTPQRIVRTNPFAAGRLIFLPDGRLLCVGREIDEQIEEIPGHSVLRFYGADGILQAKAANVNLLRPNRRDLHPINWKVASGARRIGMLDQESLRYVEFDHQGVIVRPVSPLGIDPPASVIGFALLSNGGRLVSVEHPKAAATSEQHVLYLLKDAGGGVTKRIVTEITPPKGAAGFWIAGMNGQEVVLKGISVDTMVFAPEPLA